MELSHQIIQNNDNLKAELISFVTLYGISGLQEAMRLYIETSQNYICKTKTSVRKIKIRDRKSYLSEKRIDQHIHL